MGLLLAVLGIAGCGLIADFDPPDPALEGMDGGVRPGADAGGGRSDGSRPSTDGATPDGSEVPDAGEPPPIPEGCGGPSFIQDDFEDRSEPAWATIELAAGGMVSEEGGRLQVSLPAGAAEPRAAYRSNRWFDAREDGTAVQVFVPEGDMPPEGEVILALIHDERSHVQLMLKEGHLIPVVTEAGTVTFSSSGMPYEPTEQRWWGMGGLAGRLYFATSGDGRVWRTIADLPAPAFLEAVQVAIGAVGRGGLSGPITAEMDNLALAPRTARELPCEIDSYTDLFDGPLHPYRWGRRGDETCVLGSDLDTGSLVIAPTDGNCGIISLHDYDARERAVTLEIARGPVSSTYVFQLLLLGDADLGRAEFTCSGTAGTLLQSGTDFASASFPCEEHRFWRLRHGSGFWHVEVAAEDGVFSELASVPSSWDPAQVAVLVQAVAPTRTMIDDPLLVATYNP